MSIQLCTICQSIPTKFWCYSYNNKEYSKEVSVQLQTLGNMEIAAAKGCQLYTILLKSLELFCRQNMDDYLQQGKKEMMYLRRSLGYLEHAV